MVEKWKLNYKQSVITKFDRCAYCEMNVVKGLMA